MPMYNLIEYSDNYSKTSESLWQYYKDDPNNNIARSESFKHKVKIIWKTPDHWNTKDVEILPSNQQQIKEQTKFTYSPLGKALEKQIKILEYQREKQIKAIQDQREVRTIKKYSYDITDTTFISK